MRITQVTLYVISIIITIGLWQILIPILEIPLYILPTPLNILNSLLDPSLKWVQHVEATMLIILSGFLVAVVFGIGLAFLMTVSNSAYRIFYPFLLVAQLVPKVAIAPILLVWLGLGLASKIAVVFLISFFPVLVDTMAGLRDADPQIIDVLRSLKASKWGIFAKVRLPGAVPHIFSGMKVGITLAIIGAIVAEFLEPDVGIGYLILIGSNYLRTPQIFGAVSLISLIGIALYAFLEILEKITIPWYLIPRQQKQ